jgi:hypothetical protein
LSVLRRLLKLYRECAASYLVLLGVGGGERTKRGIRTASHKAEVTDAQDK